MAHGIRLELTLRQVLDAAYGEAEAAEKRTELGQ
jgi:hypothetical protein